MPVTASKNQLSENPLPDGADREDNEQQSNEKRIVLVELAYLLSGFIQSTKLLEGIRPKGDSFEELSKVFEKLKALPGTSDSFFIRYRGKTSTAGPEKSDYIVFLDRLTLDSAMANAMTKRMGIQMHHISRRLTKAFDVFASNGVDSFFMKIPKDAAESERLRFSLGIFSLFHQAFQMNLPITYEKDGVEISTPVIDDDTGRPDPNLTILAAINNLDASAMAAMVSEIGVWLEGRGVESGAYDAIFAVDRFAKNLVKPPIEINNIRWHRIDNLGTATLQAGTSGIMSKINNESEIIVEEITVEPETDDEPEIIVKEITVEPEITDESETIVEKITIEPSDYMESDMGGKAEDPDLPQVSTKEMITDLLRKKAGKSWQFTSNAIHTLYAKDYKKIGAGEFARRLRILGEMLDAVGGKWESPEAEDEVLRKIRKGIDQVRDSAFENMLLKDGELKIRIGKKVADVGKVNPKILKMVANLRRKKITRKKMHNLIHRDISFTEADFQEIARDFGVPVEDARELIAMLKSCFDHEGKFLRNVYEKHIPVFAWYDKRIFEFMWHYLKEMMRRNDRIAFLNSLQLLISKMAEPKKYAIRTLLTDYLSTPYSVAFSDRNALMLSILLVRKYSKEINLDIEVTPEEVILVKEGVDKKLARAVRKTIDNNLRDRLLKKVRTIHRGILEALNPKKADTDPLPVRYLLSLERETFIFLCLVGGTTAKSVIRSAMEKYGNPKSDIYRAELSKRHLVPLLQHLKLIVRGMGRLGKSEDLQRFTVVSWGEEGFRNMTQNPGEIEKIKQVMEWVDITKETMAQKDMKDNRETYGFSVR